MKVLKIGADWCAECLVMKPRWKEIEEEFNFLETEYFDYDKNKDIREKYNIKHVPSFIFLDKDVNEFLRKEGIVEKSELIKIIVENKDK
ncbi:MAG: thioredoxin family protein [Patescibacteria group bacterium]|nr:thioredoxin family protein [Patescibacteria group bacterium]MDD4303998.1 thioredoxin family protein [Patescibacteria group bacterium]MDD4695013.1 thioredoxin family protein [Patescibacteria group bacterium]